MATSDVEASAALLSQAEVVARRSYSNPPLHGARIVAGILGDVELRSRWREQLRAVTQRISAMRKCLVEELTAAGAPGDWSHVTKQIGMFSYVRARSFPDGRSACCCGSHHSLCVSQTGLAADVVDELVQTHHVYMLRSGRISLAGLNPRGCSLLATAITSCLKAKAAVLPPSLASREA